MDLCPLQFNSFFKVNPSENPSIITDENISVAIFVIIFLIYAISLESGYVIGIFFFNSLERIIDGNIFFSNFVVIY